MEKFVKVSVLEHLVEAQVLEAVLTEKGIPHLIRSHFDEAYGGLFQVHRGWGQVEAPTEHKEEIVAILRELRESEPVNPEGD